MNWCFLRLQEDERDQYAGLAMTPLATRASYPYIEHDKAGVIKLLINAINAGGDGHAL